VLCCETYANPQYTGVAQVAANKIACSKITLKVLLSSSFTGAKSSGIFHSDVYLKYQVSALKKLPSLLVVFGAQKAI
jgi:hypothetical protein